MKVTVRIHTPSGLEIKKCKVSANGKKLLIRGEKNKLGVWKPEIGSMEVKRLRFGRSAYFTDVFPDADKTWVINPEQNILNTPKWDKQQSKKFIDAKLIEKTGQEPKEKISGTILWIIAILGIVNIVLTLVLSGRVHIG